MTENAFPFEGAVEEPVAPAGDRRKMVLVAGLGALIVAVLGYFVVMPAFTGGGDTGSSTVGLVRKPAAKAKTPAKTVAKKKAPAPAQYNDVSARANPFHKLYVEPKAETAAVTTNAAPSDTTAPTTTTTTDTTTAPAESTNNTSGQRVVLMTVFTKDGVSYAQTKVGDIVYLPRVGQIFAGQFKLLAVTSKSATYLYGDEQFTLSVGQEAIK